MCGTFDLHIVAPHRKLPGHNYRFVAHRGSQRLLATQWRLGRATVGQAIRDTTAAIKLRLSAEFLPSPDRTRLREEAEKFEIRWNLPNCMGALDGKHFAIVNHAHKGTIFHNYKGFFSHVLLAIVGADYKFLFVDIRGAGCSNDAGLFEDSTFGSAILDGRMALPHKRLLPGTDIEAPYVFVGDEAFPNLTCLLRPFPKTNLGPQEKCSIIVYPEPGGLWKMLLAFWQPGSASFTLKFMQMWSLLTI